MGTLTGGMQLLPGGPVASQEAIKELGTNGGGFFNPNSAHPFENLRLDAVRGRHDADLDRRRQLECGTFLRALRRATARSQVTAASDPPQPACSADIPPTAPLARLRMPRPARVDACG